ncbi:trigger factor [Calderihabitans maritimus]|uniref:Trigger factor n=1 Tax=Calderihabitans maritimus TaxID=1246530 RepID=A0A1Z5HUW5_9FIRM|nr:trigger factor [Calderihabitans maritimus]GAW93304.1 trigger factor Tig [Calderihabitans maritimus]
MKSKLEKIEKNRALMEVEVEPEELDKALWQAYRKVVKKVNIPGFRKGKAPRRLVENYVGKETLLQEALEIVIPQAYTEAVNETQIEPIDYPRLEVVQAEEGKPLIFKAEVDVKPEVRLGQYKGLEVEKEEVKIEEEDVQRYLENMQQRYAKLVSVNDGAVEEGDVVTIDFEGFIEGKPFEGGQGEDFTLEIGTGFFIPGFAEQLVGAKVDEEREINVTFPSDHPNKDLAGKEAVFKVLVKEIKRKELSPLDDEFAKDVSEFETLEELKNDIRNKLKATAEQRAEEEFRRRVVEKAVEAAEVEIPEILIKRQLESIIQEIERNLKYQGLTLDKYLEMSNLTLEKLQEKYRDQAVKRVKSDLVLEAIAKAEKIEVTEEDVDEAVTRLAESYKQDPKAVKATLAAQDNLQDLKYNLLLKKTVDFLVNSVKSA